MDERAAFATFLFTDIEGSTRLWEEHSERMRSAMARHDALLRQAVAGHGGHVVKMTGDGVHAIFADPLGALEAAVDVQRGLTDLERATGLSLRARCGVHSGTFERRDNDYYGSAVNRAARIMAAGHGGQILVSALVVEAIGARMIPGLAVRDLGKVRLRDLARGEQLFQVIHPGLRTEFPVLRSLEKTPNNLPHALSSFVGRELEMAEVRALLAQLAPAHAHRHGRAGQDAPVAAGGRGVAGFVSRRRVAGGARARSTTRGAWRRRPPRRWACTRKPAARWPNRSSGTCTTASCWSSSTTASTCSRPLRRSRARCWWPGRAYASSPPAASRCAWRAR